MKISQFAKKFGIGINTVRYYVNAGLIVPEKRNGQNCFNEQNLEEMGLILDLKKYDFSIRQIHNIISLGRISSFTDKDDVEGYLKILGRQRDFLTNKADRLKETIADLDNYMESVLRKGDDIIVQPCKSGVPLEFMQHLCCPHCGPHLNYKDTTIVNSQIFHAQAFCECGYKFKIENGILITDGDFINELDSPDVDRKFYKDLPASWITLFQKSYIWMYAQIKDMNLKGKIVMENHINCYFFLYTMLSRLDKDALYIISDKYLEIVALYKDLIERQNPGLKILFMADSSFKYPLKKDCVDLYIDYCSINEYSIFEKTDDLLGVMLPYIKKEAPLLGTFFHFESRSLSHAKLLKEYPHCRQNNYLLSFYKELASRHGLKQVKTEKCGFVTDACGANRNFSFHAAGDKMSLLSYQWAQPD